MKTVRHFLTICAAIGLGSCSFLGSDALTDAQQAFDAQDYIAARDLALAALVDDGDNIEALELLARAQLAMGQGEEVLATIERIRQAGGNPGEQTLIAAEGRLQAGDVTGARELIGDDASAEAWRLRGLLAALENDEAGAMEAFLRGRRATGEKAKLYSAEASFHLNRDNLQAAEEAVALAQDAAPDRVETLFVAARLADARGEHFQAMSQYLRIIEIVPLDRPALLAAIGAAEAAGERDVTRHLIAYGAQTRPLDREFVYQQARVEAWDGDWEAVRQRLQASEAELQDHDPARLLYAEALLNLGQVETARAIAGPIIARRQGDAAAMRLQSAIEAAS
ncbi:tetratricopeptide repeat protein [Aurantiacibacter sp. MUD11]|uniref:tetratricopeptide repeat protein n=1 Tax=Aurantiacibacter sp. MUD11 TaxID=3003265 RepID=UPI0022AA2638|nr:tetratricopeptide repeat protein [Aurantiacibacter sp. MUD11]WAT18405.1 tetratricopeptide repeat protein [Aurantiacibacter sp. MUD11]